MRPYGGLHLLLVVCLGASAAVALGEAIRVLRMIRFDWWHVFAAGCFGASAAASLFFAAAMLRLARNLAT